MSENSYRNSQKRGSVCLSSDEESAYNPEKRHGLSASPSASMASNSSLHWPPLPGGSGGAQAEVVTDVNMLPVNNFVSPECVEAH